jgi:hypothetical protein
LHEKKDITSIEYATKEGNITSTSIKRLDYFGRQFEPYYIQRICQT